MNRVPECIDLTGLTVDESTPRKPANPEPIVIIDSDDEDAERCSAQQVKSPSLTQQKLLCYPTSASTRVQSPRESLQSTAAPNNRRGGTTSMGTGQSKDADLPSASGQSVPVSAAAAKQKDTAAGPRQGALHAQLLSWQLITTSQKDCKVACVCSQWLLHSFLLAEMVCMNDTALDAVFAVTMSTCILCMQLMHEHMIVLATPILPSVHS